MRQAPVVLLPALILATRKSSSVPRNPLHHVEADRFWVCSFRKNIDWEAWIGLHDLQEPVEIR